MPFREIIAVYSLYTVREKRRIINVKVGGMYGYRMLLKN